MATIFGGSFASPAANADFVPPFSGDNIVTQIYDRTNWWNLSLTFLLVLIAYDQCMLTIPHSIDPSNSD